MSLTEPPDPESFNRTVWMIVRQVPAGFVTTYGQIASMLPALPDVDPDDFVRLCPRWVGKAMNAVSSVDSKSIPWWRVINARGGISLPGISGEQQQTRLKREGIAFNEKGLVDFKICGWQGPDEDWLAEGGFLPPRPLVPESPPDTPTQLSLF